MNNYNFLQVSKNEIPKTRLGELVADNNFVDINLIPNEDYIQYLIFEEDIIDVDSIKLQPLNLDYTTNIDYKIVGNVLVFAFEFAEEYLDKCLYFEISINGSETYYTNIFTVENSNIEKTTLLTYWHKENLENIPYFDVKGENYIPQQIRVDLFYTKPKHDVDSEVYTNSMTSPNTLRNGRVNRLRLEIWENYTSQYNHQALAHALDCDFVYFNNVRIFSKPYEFEEDSDNTNYTQGTLELQRDLTQVFEMPNFNYLISTLYLLGYNLYTKLVNDIVYFCIDYSFSENIDFNTNTDDIIIATYDLGISQYKGIDDFPNYKLSITDNLLTLELNESILQSSKVELKIIQDKIKSIVTNDLYVGNIVNINLDEINLNIIEVPFSQANLYENGYFRIFFNLIPTGGTYVYAIYNAIYTDTIYVEITIDGITYYYSESSNESGLDIIKSGDNYEKIKIYAIKDWKRTNIFEKSY